RAVKRGADHSRRTGSSGITRDAPVCGDAARWNLADDAEDALDEVRLSLEGISGHRYQLQLLRICGVCVKLSGGACQIMEYGAVRTSIRLASISQVNFIDGLVKFITKRLRN